MIDKNKALLCCSDGMATENIRIASERVTIVVRSCGNVTEEGEVESSKLIKVAPVWVNSGFLKDIRLREDVRA